MSVDFTRTGNPTMTRKMSVRAFAKGASRAVALGALMIAGLALPPATVESQAALTPTLNVRKVFASGFDMGLYAETGGEFGDISAEMEYAVPATSPRWNTGIHIHETTLNSFPTHESFA